MSAAEIIDREPEGGVILWGSEPPEDDDNFIVRLRLRDGRHTWSSAWKSDIHDNGVDYELAHAEDEDLIGAEIVGYCRGPDPSGSVAYQLHEKPGEGLGS